MTAPAELLSTLAIFKANYDVGRDYLSNFEPFVADVLKHWPQGESVTPRPLRQALGDRYGLPLIPINTAIGLRDRAHRDGLLAKSGKNYFPSRVKLDGLPDLRAASAEAGARVALLKSSLVAYARDAYDLTWTDDDASDALERLVSEFGIELALARRQDGAPSFRVSDDGHLTVAFAFSRHTAKADPAQFRCLEELVMGTMLANALYFANLGQWTRDLSRTRVFLDTSLIVRLLGFSSPEVCAAVEELLALLKSAKAVVRVFRHTLEEVCGVLDGVAANLDRERRGQLDSSRLVAVNREVLDHLIRRGATASDVREVTADVERRLLRLGVGVEDMPDYPRRPDFSEEEIEAALEAALGGYKSDAARRKDAASLAGIHILRGGKSPRDIGEAAAIFVTSNRAVIRASRRYFAENWSEGQVGHCVSEASLTTQLWLRQPGKVDVARTTLLAQSVAALNPRPELWERYLVEIERSRDRGEIDEQQVKALVYSMEAREGLLEVTHAASEKVDGETPSQVLARYEEELRRPAEARAEAADAKAEALRSDLQRSQDVEQERELRLKRLEAQSEEVARRAEAADERARRLERLRRLELEDQARKVARRLGRVAAVALAVAVLSAATVGGLGLFGASPFDLPNWASLPLVGFAIAGLLFGAWLSHHGGSVQSVRRSLEQKVLRRLQERRTSAERRLLDAAEPDLQSEREPGQLDD